MTQGNCKLVFLLNTCQAKEVQQYLEKSVKDVSELGSGVHPS